MDRLRKLLLTGFILIFIGFVALFLALLREGVATGGGAFVVFIGPFPLAIGFGEYSPLLILLSIIIAVAMVIIMLASVKRVSGKQRDDSNLG